MSPVVASRLSGVVVLTLGLIAAALARLLPVQTGFGLGPAFLPFWTGLVLAASGIWLCVRPPAEPPGERPGWGGLARGAVGFSILILYALFLEPLGYLVSTAGFLVAGIFLLDPVRPARALFIGLSSSVFLLLIFRVWLRVPLPGGLLGW